MELIEIQKEVEKELSEKRYYHSVCVMEKCEELAIKYNVDVETAKKVGIAHDIAKEMPEAAKLEYIKLNNIEADDIELKYPTLLHAKIGADILMKRFDFSKEMSQAVLSHTTGKANMDMLAKVLYIADWIGEDRDYEDTKYLRDLANEDIDQAIIYSLGRIIEEKLEKQEEIHIDTVLTINDLLKKGGK